MLSEKKALSVFEGNSNTELKGKFVSWLAGYEAQPLQRISSFNNCGIDLKLSQYILIVTLKTVWASKVEIFEKGLLPTPKSLNEIP